MISLRKVSLLTLTLLTGIIPSFADSRIEVSIDGKIQPRQLTGMEFVNDNIVLSFSDGHTDTVDMSLVTINCYYDESGTNVITIDTSEVRHIYNISGMHVGSDTTVLTPGIYIIDGKKIIIQ